MDITKKDDPRLPNLFEKSTEFALNQFDLINLGWLIPFKREAYLKRKKIGKTMLEKYFYLRLQAIAFNIGSIEE